MIKSVYVNNLRSYRSLEAALKARDKWMAGAFIAVSNDHKYSWKILQEGR